MPKTSKTEICPNCRTLNPLAEYHYPPIDLLFDAHQRYRYPDRQRLYAGFEVVEVLGYVLERLGCYSEGLAPDEFDERFAEWLEWKPSAVPDEANDASESKQTSDHSWLTRNRTHFRKRARLRCGCSVTIELARSPSADHLYIENVSQGCEAHASIGGYAMDMRGRCYVCEWPITAQAKSVTTKLNKYDPTYQAVALAEGE